MDNHNMFHKLTTAKINSHTSTIHPQYCQHWALGQGCLCLILPVMAIRIVETHTFCKHFTSHKSLNNCVVHSSIHDYYVIFIRNIKSCSVMIRFPFFSRTSKVMKDLMNLATLLLQVGNRLWRRRSRSSGKQDRAPAPALPLVRRSPWDSVPTSCTSVTSQGDRRLMWQQQDWSSYVMTTQ